MINLNDSTYIEVTKEDLLKHYTEYDIFKNYLGDFDLGKTLSSPLRSKDSDPSFNIFYSRRHDCLLFKDFAGKRGDCVVFVQELYGLPTYQDAVRRIAQDMSITISKPTAQVRIMRISKIDYDLTVVTRKWEQRDLDFWNQFGISRNTLELFNVLPISAYYHGGFFVKTPDIAYVYLEYKDDKLTYKVYRPLAKKRNKWRNSNPYSVHQGYNQLPRSGPLLIITKALKDVMSLYECVGVPSIGIQSETCYIKETVVDEYKTRFRDVYTLFDNDEPGRNQAESYKSMYNIDPIFVPDQYDSKDFSDLVMTVGPKEAKNIFINLITKINSK